MHFAMGASRIVWKLFEFTLEQRDFVAIAKLIGCRSCIFVLGKNCMKFVNYSFGQRATMRHAIHHQLDGALLIA